ncbi:MAG: AAA family ATPase [Lachnospiraceae bacterium]|jgi:predicted ATPase|nr:AAA family ATPase [Lachnospiraceae bacterium]
MIYLSQFIFPSVEREEHYLNFIKETCYTTVYPFQILTEHNVHTLNFDDPITVLYGGNGSGKTTALNVIAEKLVLKRDSLYNRTNFFGKFVDMCEYYLERELPSFSRIITSDDVFDFMLNLRSLNEGIDNKRESLFENYQNLKHSSFQLKSIDDYEKLVEINLARSKTKSEYVRRQLKSNVREHSNGESAYMYFTDKMKENGLYLLDEPENSLSPERQQELACFLEESARFFGCQFIIATHSPFLLSMKNAKIYNLDEEQMRVSKWTNLPNVRVYYDFFKRHEGEFE